MSRIRIVVADQAEAIFYDLSSLKAHPIEVARMSDPAAHLHDRDFSSDRPGRSYESFGKARHAIEGENDPRRREAVKFAKEIATRLDLDRRKQGVRTADRRRRRTVPQPDAHRILDRHDGQHRARGAQGSGPQSGRGLARAPADDGAGTEVRLIRPTLRAASGRSGLLSAARVCLSALQKEDRIEPPAASACLPPLGRRITPALRPRTRSRAASACHRPGCEGDCRMPSSGKTTASMVWSPATKRNAGKVTVRSRSKRSRRSSVSCGTPRSSSRIETASADSENRCRCMSECAEAVPVSTGPTRRGSNSAIRRMACRAERRRSAISSWCRSSANSRRRANSAASISVLRGRIAASTTPSRAAALRLANRKSSMPCSAITRAASSATA